MSHLKSDPTRPQDTLQGVYRPESLPVRGNRLTQRFAWWVLRRFGWDIRGVYPDTSKFLIIGAPHSSNWDWFWGMWVMWALGVRFSYMIKDAFFFPPLGAILRWMGGVKVERGAGNSLGLIKASIQAFEQNKKLVLFITPEGRTKPVRTLKRGFYTIAKSAQVPVLVVSFRYDEKAISLDGMVDMNGPFDEVEKDLKAHYHAIKGRHRGYLDNLENWAISPLPKDTKIYD